MLDVGSMAGRTASGAVVDRRVDPIEQNRRSATSCWNARNIGPMTSLSARRELIRRETCANYRRGLTKGGDPTQFHLSSAVLAAASFRAFASTLSSDTDAPFCRLLSSAASMKA